MGEADDSDRTHAMRWKDAQVAQEDAMICVNAGPRAGSNSDVSAYLWARGSGRAGCCD